MLVCKCALIVKEQFILFLLKNMKKKKTTKKPCSFWQLGWFDIILKYGLWKIGMLSIRLSLETSDTCIAEMKNNLVSAFIFIHEDTF